MEYILFKIFGNYTEDFLSVKLKLFATNVKKTIFLYESCKKKSFSHFHENILEP